MQSRILRCQYLFHGGKSEVDQLQADGPQAHRPNPHFWLVGWLKNLRQSREKEGSMKCPNDSFTGSLIGWIYTTDRSIKIRAKRKRMDESSRLSFRTLNVFCSRKLILLSTCSISMSSDPRRLCSRRLLRLRYTLPYPRFYLNGKFISSTSCFYSFSGMLLVHFRTCSFHALAF